MPDTSKPTKPTKPPKVKKTLNELLGEGQVKKTLNELLGEGQVKTGKALLELAAQKTQQQEVFLAAAQDEERMRSQKVKRAQ